jgi:hypothetical protein
MINPASNPSIFRKYLVSVYWAITTVSTATGGKVIFMPPCMFHPWFSVQTNMGGGGHANDFIARG